LKFDNLNIEDNDSKKLLVTFGGIRQGMGMPVYEFYNSLKDLDCDKIFIKDVYQAWYHKGVNEEINSILKLKVLLEEVVKKKPYDKIVFIGNSMGGYGAILFGILLNVDCVVAFSPQTFINKLNRLWFKDGRWDKEISNVYFNNSFQKKFYNLKNFLRNNTYSTQIDIFYSANDKLDSLHSERLKSLKKVTLYSYQKGDHNLIKELRADDELFRIIRERILKE